MGNITACNTISEFISYQIDQNPVRYIVANITASGRGTTSGTNSSGIYISAYNIVTPNISNGFYLSGNTAIPGIYTTSMFSISEAADIGQINVQTVNTISFNLSTVGAIGQYIDITFNGTYTNTTGSHSITGVAHVIRDN